MAPSQRNALAKRSSDSILMPPPASKRQKRPSKVLEEDVYTEALSKIIARDFFPGLRETEVQEEYMEALKSKNNDWIREAGRKLTQAMTPVPEGKTRRGRGTAFTPRATTDLGVTPRGFAGETPSRTPRSDAASETQNEMAAEIDTNMSLGAFQAKYTSEDNESFNSLLDKQNEDRVKKYSYFHNGNKIPSARQIAHRAREQKLLADQGQSSALIIVNSSKEQRLSVGGNRPSEDLSQRPASLDSFRDRQGPRNPFMFGPDSVEDRFTTNAQSAFAKSNAPLQSVNLKSTRFETSDQLEANVIPPSPSMSAIDAALNNRPRPTGSEPGYSGADTPRVNGYAFVDAEPTPSEMGIPVTDEEADAAEREAAMQLLPKMDGDGPSMFTIHERSKRENLHMKLVERADLMRRPPARIQALRGSNVSSLQTPTPKCSSTPSRNRGGSMTPAAQRLADSLSTPKRDGGIFSASKNSLKFR